MTKKEYIQNLENLIVNRVKYHSPEKAEYIDFSLLDAVGIDASYPIFIFDRSLDNIYYKAFYQAKKRVDFNLILTQKTKVSEKRVKQLNKTFIIYKEEMGSILTHTLNSLNINYVTHSDFKNKLDGEYIKVDGQKIEYDYLPYFYTKKNFCHGVIVDSKIFLLNGKNYLINFTNTQNKVQKINFEFNLPLPRGYYSFKRGDNFIGIENLTSQAKAFFNYNLKNSKISFSTMCGIESCNFACINFFCQVELLPKENKKCYFNFGENKYCLKNPKEMQMFFEISQNKMNEIFDVKVLTRDNQFDQMFNLSLPRNIWEKWQNFEIDEKSENLWLKLKNEILNIQQNGIKISQEFKGLKEVKIYRNLGWKRVFIVHNNCCYMYADKVKYFNFTLLTKEIFDKNNEIYLSFAN